MTSNNIGEPCHICKQFHPSTMPCRDANLEREIKIEREVEIETETSKILSIASSKAKKDVPDYLQQVIDEQLELNKKLVKLIQFTTTDTFRKLCVPQHDMLTYQMRAMMDYNNVLADRIGHQHD